MTGRAVIAAALLAGGTAGAQEAVVYPYDGSFEDAAFAVESAIIGQGLVIDHVAHTGAMLARTAEDLGAEKTLFAAADVYLFCSAVLSREVMEADPMNLAHCPWGIFIYERQGEVGIGYRTMPEGEMQKVEKLLDTIAQDAAAF